jgi:hypothetical protein
MRMGGLRGRASVPIFRTPEHKGKISRDRLGRQDLRLVLEPGPWHNREVTAGTVTIRCHNERQ